MSWRRAGIGWLCIVAALLGAAALARGQGVRYPYPRRPAAQRGQALRNLTIAEQRKLGLSDEQIRRIAEKRRDLERERDALKARLDAAREAARQAQSRVGTLQAELQVLDGERLEAIFKSVMTPEQFRQWDRQRTLDMARQWLRGYARWLDLSEVQQEDIAQLLVPVYEKFDRMEERVDAAREELEALRRAETIDIAAIEKAEQRLAELLKQNVYQARHAELIEALRTGLLPDQLEKLNRRHRR